MNSVTDSAWHRPAWSHDLPAEPAVAHPAPGALLHDGFLTQAVATPEATAVVSAERSLTYRELDAESGAVARALTTGGAGPDTLVGVVMEKGWEQIVACLGVLRSGAAYVPLDPRWPSERLRGVLESAAVGQVLVQPGLSDHAGLPGTVSVTVVGRPAPGTVPDPAETRGRATSGDLAYVIYTSGSTGVPKGVMIEHGSALNTVLDVNEELSLTADDRVLALSALNFDLSVYDIFGPLSVGGAVVIPAPEDQREPGDWLRLAAGADVTVWNSVPALMSMLCEHVAAAPKPPDLPPLRAVLLSGDWIPVSLPADVRRLFPEAVLWGLGGATEASIWSIRHRVVPSDETLASIPYGVSMRNQRVFVADGAMRPRPCWVPGEIYIAGAGLARGYLGDEERTARSFRLEGTTGARLYRTGDWGRLLPDGEIEFLGREDMQVKIGGHRIELGEVESALLGCPGVRMAVASVNGDRGRTRLAAHLVLEPGSRRTGAEVRRLLADRLPGYMIPTVVSVRDELPLTPNGKVDRKALAELPGGLAPLPVEPPADAEEQVLLAVWSEFFALPGLSVTDNFFELGGDSLKAVRLAAALRRATGVEVPVSALFRSPTVRSLAPLLTRLRQATASAG
ncbi:amino acid adenylation domain-containing protein [Streptomyces sp. NPDC023723]|uniref:amino acid adenylation domain-containing protein n=1 Tax=Streptomyces sp. NPDC023723 TaxID=3154323 RepID=UPI0033DC5DE8